jgi:hypothetical protein
LGICLPGTGRKGHDAGYQQPTHLLRSAALLYAFCAPVMDEIWAAPAVLTPRASVALRDQVYDASNVNPFLKRRSAWKY